MVASIQMRCEGIDRDAQGGRLLEALPHDPRTVGQRIVERVATVALCALAIGAALVLTLTAVRLVNAHTPAPVMAERVVRVVGR